MKANRSANIWTPCEIISYRQFPPWYKFCAVILVSHYPSVFAQWYFIINCISHTATHIIEALWNSVKSRLPESTINPFALSSENLGRIDKILSPSCAAALSGEMPNTESLISSRTFWRRMDAFGFMSWAAWRDVSWALKPGLLGYQLLGSFTTDICIVLGSWLAM